jgi:hypothetical protein
MENIINVLKIIKDVYYINISDNLEEWNYIPNHTVIELVDVSILGKAQTIQPTGAPIMELYSFVARNIV